MLDDLHFAIERGKIHAIIGPNGAGKTTFINVVTGFLKPFQGRVFFKGGVINHLSAHEIALRGISRTFQNLELAHSLSVRDNLLLSSLPKKVMNLMRHPFNFVLGNEKLTKLNRLIDALDLGEHLSKKVSQVPYGIKKKIEIARALSMEAEILILDEPVAGLNTKEKDFMKRFLKKINLEEKLTIIIVEHDIRFLSKLAHVMTVFNYGHLIFTGTPREAIKDPNVIEVYLGHKKE